MEAMLSGLAPAVSGRHLIISVAAGIPTDFISRHFKSSIPVIRVMPNTPALIQEGASALCKGRNATDSHLKIAQSIFSAVGKVVIVDESLMDAVTGLSGSGPAYVFLFIEALADAGVKMGLSRQVALLLATQTCLGSAKMIAETGEHPAKLRDMVTSPGGTTISGLHKLEAGPPQISPDGCGGGGNQTFTGTGCRQAINNGGLMGRGLLEPQGFQKYGFSDQFGE